MLTRIGGIVSRIFDGSLSLECRLRKFARFRILQVLNLECKQIANGTFPVVF